MLVSEESSSSEELSIKSLKNQTPQISTTSLIVTNEAYSDHDLANIDESQTDLSPQEASIIFAQMDGPLKNAILALQNYIVQIDNFRDDLSKTRAKFWKANNAIFIGIAVLLLVSIASLSYFLYAALFRPEKNSKSANTLLFSSVIAFFSAITPAPCCVFLIKRDRIGKYRMSKKSDMTKNHHDSLHGLTEVLDTILNQLGPAGTLSFERAQLLKVRDNLKSPELRVSSLMHDLQTLKDELLGIQVKLLNGYRTKDPTSPLTLDQNKTVSFFPFIENHFESIPIILNEDKDSSLEMHPTRYSDQTEALPLLSLKVSLSQSDS